MAVPRESKMTKDAESYAELPEYSAVVPNAVERGSRAPISRTHAIELKDTKGRAWLKLSVRSGAPGSSSLPSVRGGDEICGVVEVDLEKAQACKGVNVAVVGECTAVGQEPIPFVNVGSTLWTPSSTSPKLTGKLEWPFALTLHEQCSMSTGSKGETEGYSLPPTFTERASPAYIDYKIIVTIKRPMLKVNQILCMSFGYTPRWSAPKPTALRMVAYREGGSLIGPEGDPDGWDNIELPSIDGKVFELQTVDVEAKLFISKPTSYTIGSPIHLHLILRGTNTQALDLLSLPAAPRVALTRTISIGTTATDDTSPRRSNNTFPEHIARAHWWPLAEGAPEDNVRILRGEIDVPRTAKPSFLFPRFSLRYYISVLPFSAPGYVPANQEQLLSSTKVMVVTENAAGVVPRSHAPPGYEKGQEGNWNTSMGYLENGNQRFYHHHMR